MATHSSILAWRIPWTEEPGGLQPMGSQRVGHTQLHIYLPIHPSIYLSSHLSNLPILHFISLPISIHPSILSIQHHPSIYLPTYLIYLLIYSFFLSIIYVSIYHRSIH